MRPERLLRPLRPEPLRSRDDKASNCQAVISIVRIPVKLLGVCRVLTPVTDLQRPPSERTPEEKLWDFKTRAQQYARDRESCDDTRISYLEFLETEAEDDLALARMIAG
jgi:hypothetical protein